MTVELFTAKEDEDPLLFTELLSTHAAGPTEGSEPSIFKKYPIGQDMHAFAFAFLHVLQLLSHRLLIDPVNTLARLRTTGATLTDKRCEGADFSADSTASSAAALRSGASVLIVTVDDEVAANRREPPLGALSAQLAPLMLS